MIAALFVERGGPYGHLPGVDAWTEAEDARLYGGPHPVVAHPPCTRWGRYWGGGPSASIKKHKGDDHGCFASALWAVRTFGGVLEHPEASHAWDWFGLKRPPFNGGWVESDAYGGWSCCVAQGHYGHPSQKMTWLYAVGVDRPELRWGRASGLVRLDEGFHSKEEREALRSAGRKPVRRLTREERVHTPIPFRDLLIRIASSAAPASSAPSSSS